MAHASQVSPPSSGPVLVAKLSTVNPEHLAVFDFNLLKHPPLGKKSAYYSIKPTAVTVNSDTYKYLGDAGKGSFSTASMFLKVPNPPFTTTPNSFIVRFPHNLSNVHLKGLEKDIEIRKKLYGGENLHLLQSLNISKPPTQSNPSEPAKIYFTLEPYEGVTFDAIFENITTLENVLKLYLLLAIAMKTDLKDNGLLHGDFKPNNILVNDSKIRFIDFELSYYINDIVATTTKSKNREFRHIAPERTELGFPSPCYSQDIYSLGYIIRDLHKRYPHKPFPDVLKKFSTKAVKLPKERPTIENFILELEAALKTLEQAKSPISAQAQLPHTATRLLNSHGTFGSKQTMAASSSVHPSRSNIPRHPGPSRARQLAAADNLTRGLPSHPSRRP